MTHFNLVRDPWIPVRYLDASSKLVSLEGLFKDCASIADLDCQAHERISLMRLLVCITQAELGAPDTPEDWGDFGSDLESRAVAYLKRSDIQPHFNLFGDGSRFLQGIVNENEKSYLATQMVFYFATGNSPTLLDHSGGTDRVLTCDFLARTLLAYQNFFVGGSMASKVKGNGPSLKFLHSFLFGKNLKKSILLNCLDSETLADSGINMGRPIWENNSQASTSTYLGRLVPFSCKVRLHTNQIHAWIEDGLAYPEFPESREPAATIGTKGDQRFLLRADLGKGIWKDLHVVLNVQRSGATTLGAPLCLRSHLGELEEGEFQLWLAELCKAKDAKIIDLLESHLSVPISLLNDRGRAHYESGITFADIQSNQLFGAVKQNGAALKNENPPTDEAKKQFWHALEAQCSVLLQIAGTPDILNGLSFGEGNDDWTVAVRRAAKEAYDHVCPRQTPRQMQAYAAGLKVLFPKPKKKKAATT